MALFGRKKSDLDYPPGTRDAEAHAEQSIASSEPTFREHPVSLEASSLVEKAKAGEAIGMVPELDEYYDGWIHYAQDRNLFSGPEIRALAQARREAIQLAHEKKYDDLQAKLEELSGPLAAEIERAAEENMKRIQESREATPLEKKEALTEAVQGMEQLRVPKDQSPEMFLDRHAEREKKAEKFAEKYGITAEHEALLAAEEKYAAAIRQRHTDHFSLKFRDETATRKERSALESAIKNWRGALAEAGLRAGEEGSKQDKISAQFISSRDAMMRMEEVRQRAIAEGLDARSKTTIGKVDAFFNRTAARALGGAAAIGEGFGKASEFVGGKVAGLVLDKEKDAEKFRRASRIIGSAAIMTAVFVPFGAVTAGAAGLMFVGRAARGIGGWILGSAAGVGAGELYEEIYASFRGTKEERLREHELNQGILVNALRTGIVNAYSQEQLARLYKKGSGTQFSKSEREHAERKLKAEMATAALVAGVSAYGLSHFPPVHEAITAHPVPGVHPEPPPQAPHAAEHPPFESHAAHHAPEAIAPSVHIEPVSVQGNVNDADKLFGRFLNNVNHQFPDPKTAPPALRTLLEQYHRVDGMHQQDVLTKFLHLQNGGSVVVHPGDTLSYENGKIIFQGHTLIDEQGTVHDFHAEPRVQYEHAHTERALQAAPEQQHEAAAQPEPTTQPAPSVVPPPEPAAPEVVQAPIEHATPPVIEAAPVESAAPHIVPSDHAPMPVETIPTHPDVQSNETVPPVETGGALNHFGFDLSKPSVGMDGRGNLFAHIVRTGDLTKDNELAYNTAVQYATQHHDAAVYYTVESRTVFGTPKFDVFAVKYNPDHNNWNYFPNLDDPYKMPSIPKDEELRSLTS